MSESIKSEAQHTSERPGGNDGSPGKTYPSVPGFRLATLTRIAGEALADMGISQLDARLLEPIARAIHELGTPGEEEDPN